EALVVDGDNVAGVVPAFRRHFQHARFFGAQIAEHHVRAFDVKPPALVDALDLFELRLHARQQPSDATELVEHRRVERHDGGAFGYAVTFENAQAEFFKIDLPGRLLHRLGTGEHVAQRAKIIWVGDPRITVEKRISAE